MPKELPAVEIPLHVEFYDVDSMDVVWHGNYVKYMERARCALLDTVGFGYKEMRANGYAFPITNITIKYVRPLRFGEDARIRAVLVEYENCIKINYEIFDESGAICTKAQTVQMTLKIDTWESSFVCPAIFIEKVKAAMTES